MSFLRPSQRSTATHNAQGTRQPIVQQSNPLMSLLGLSLIPLAILTTQSPTPAQSIQPIQPPQPPTPNFTPPTGPRRLELPSRSPNRLLTRPTTPNLPNNLLNQGRRLLVNNQEINATWIQQTPPTNAPTTSPTTFPTTTPFPSPLPTSPSTTSPSTTSPLPTSPLPTSPLPTSATTTSPPSPPSPTTTNPTTTSPTTTSPTPLPQPSTAPLWISINDTGLQQISGLEFLDSNDPNSQPIRWTPLSLNPLTPAQPQTLTLPAQRLGNKRYLDLRPLIEQLGWQIQPNGNTLTINTNSPQLPSLLQPLTRPSFTPRSIAWAPGLTWQQQIIRLGTAEFPIHRLQLNLKQPGLQLRPIWSVLSSMTGTAPLVTTAETWQVQASINGGYFNRNNRYPLGALKTQGQWLSGPILGRGAVAWDDRGNLIMDRLTLQETITTPSGTLPLLALNSGYVQAGFARYTATWGPAYIPITDGEVILTVENNQVTQQQLADKADSGSYPIPPRGYLLVARSNRTAALPLTPGTPLQLTSGSLPKTFDQYSHILGAGPLLIQDSRIVLDAASERFSAAFIKEQAVRSVIARFPDGSLSLLAVHERSGGRGPTLAELAQILQTLGATQALNLDGGSSTQLFLGGQLINRSSGAARVHNGLGVFLAP